MKKKKAHESCDCLFCNAKCPECGSTEINVTYKPEFNLSNDEKNALRFYHMGGSLGMECTACGMTIDEWDNDDRLKSLEAALISFLNISDTTIVIDDEGNINTERI